MYINAAVTPYNTAYGLYIAEPYGHNGDWCAQWKWDTKPEMCFSDFPSSSKDLETGMEYATKTSTGATNFGMSIPWGQWMDGSWHEEWAASGAHAEPYVSASLCNDAPLPGYKWGSVEFWGPESPC